MNVVQELHRYRWEIEDALGLSGKVTYHELPGLIEAGRLVLYANDAAILICEPLRIFGGWILCIFVACGDMKHVLALVEHAEKAAKENGALAVTVVGRPGWMKIGRKLGYRTDAVTLVKEL